MHFLNFQHAQNALNIKVDNMEQNRFLIFKRQKMDSSRLLYIPNIEGTHNTHTNNLLSIVMHIPGIQKTGTSVKVWETTFLTIMDEVSFGNDDIII